MCTYRACSKRSPFASKHFWSRFGQLLIAFLTSSILIFWYAITISRLGSDNILKFLFFWTSWSQWSHVWLSKTFKSGLVGGFWITFFAPKILCKYLSHSSLVCDGVPSCKKYNPSYLKEWGITVRDTLYKCLNPAKYLISESI